MIFSGTPGYMKKDDEQYMPYSSQGPYQALMSQMANYGGASGTDYQKAMQNATTAPAASSKVDQETLNIYKRLMAAFPKTAPERNSTIASSMPSYYGSGAGLAQFGGSGFSPEVAPYANRAAAYLGNMGFTGLSDAIAKNVYTNYGNEGRNYPTYRESISEPSEGTRGGGGDGGGDGGGVATGGNNGDASGGGDRGTRGGFAKGGHVNGSMLSGPNPTGPDQGYAALKGGEYVIKDSAVKKYGIELMDAINSGKISKGKLRGLLEM